MSNMANRLRAVAVAVAALMIPAAAQAEELKFANFMPPTHPYVAAAFDPFAEAVTTGTGGALSVAVFNGGELGAGPVEQYSRVVDGVADLAFGLPGYTASTFPLTLMTELPGVLPGEDPVAFLEAHRDALASEFRRVELVALWPNTENLILTRDKAIRAPADLKGLKLRVPSRNSGLMLEAWGATPVSMPVTDIYNSLQTGVIDGALIDASALQTFRLSEVVNHVTRGMKSTASPFFVIMDRHAFKDLNDGARETVHAAGQEMARNGYASSVEMERAALAAFAEQERREVITLSGDEAGAFDALSETFVAARFAELEGEGGEVAAAAASLRGTD